MLRTITPPPAIGCSSVTTWMERGVYASCFCLRILRALRWTRVIRSSTSIFTVFNINNCFLYDIKTSSANPPFSIRHPIHVNQTYSVMERTGSFNEFRTSSPSLASTGCCMFYYHNTFTHSGWVGSPSLSQRQISNMDGKRRLPCRGCCTYLQGLQGYPFIRSFTGVRSTHSMHTLVKGLANQTLYNENYEYRVQSHECHHTQVK